MVGDGGGPTYKSRRGNAEIDRAVTHVLAHSGLTPKILDFSPYGYDERQYCSPGFNLPVGLFQRSKFGEIPSITPRRTTSISYHLSIWTNRTG